MHFPSSLYAFLFFLTFTILSFKIQAQPLTPQEDTVSHKFGYVNAQGKWKIKPSFSAASDFAGASAIVAVENKYGLINSKGNFLLQPTMDMLYGEDVLIFKKGDTMGLVHHSGSILHQGTYSHIYYEPMTGSALLQNDSLYGYWDTTNTFIAPFSKYELMFENGLAYFNTGTTKGFITKKGEKILEIKDGSLIELNGKGFVVSGADGDTLKENYCNSQGKWIGRFDKIIQVTDSNIVYRNEGKYGIISPSGKNKIMEEYSYISPFNKRGYCIFRKDERYGIMDSLLQVVLIPENDYIEDFGDDKQRLYGSYRNEREFTIIKKDNHFGILNNEGKIIMPSIYKSGRIEEDFFIYEEGNFIKVKNLQIGRDALPSDIFITTSGKSVYPELKDSIFTYGLINSDGRIIVPPVYTSIQPLYNGLFIVNDGKSAGVLDTIGRPVVPCTYRSLYILNDLVPFKQKNNILIDNYIYAFTKSGAAGVADRRGKLIIDTIWKSVTVYDDDGDCFFAKDKKDQWKMITSQGKVTSVALDQPVLFSRQIAIGKSKGKTGGITSEAKVKIPFKYEEIVPQHNGLFFIKKGGKWGLLSANCKTIVKPQFEDVSEFKGNFALAKKGAWGILGVDGAFTQGFKMLDSMVLPEKQQLHGTSLFSFNLSEVEKIDELSFNLLGDTTLAVSVAANNFVLDKLKGNLRSNFHYEPVVIRTDIDILEDRESYYGKGIEVVNATRQTVSLNFYEEISNDGSSKVADTSEVYWFNQGKLSLVKLEDLFRDSSYTSFLNEAIASRLREDYLRVIPSYGSRLLFNPTKFQISQEGLVFKVDETILDLAMDFSGTEMVLSYEELEEIVRKDGPLGEFYKK